LHFLFGDLGLGGDVWGFIECWRGDFVVRLLRVCCVNNCCRLPEILGKNFLKLGGGGINSI